MKNLFKIFVLLSLVFANCTSEEEEFDYVVSIRNTSNVILNIKGFNSAVNQLKYDFDLESMNNSSNIKYSSPSFGGYVSGADSIIFTFPDNKGYICVVRTSKNSGNPDQYCFSNKSPFNSNSFQNIGGNNYTFIITQEDYENAHELP